MRRPREAMEIAISKRKRRLLVPARSLHHAAHRDEMPYVCYTPGKWQAASWADALASRGGTTSRQMGCAFQQRVWNGQPEGGLTGLGTSPVRMMRLRVSSISGSGKGLAE